MLVEGTAGMGDRRMMTSAPGWHAKAQGGGASGTNAEALKLKGRRAPMTKESFIGPLLGSLIMRPCVNCHPGIFVGQLRQQRSKFL